jgi:uncharacterized protein YuzE
MIAVTYDKDAGITYIYLRDGEVDKTYIGPGESYNIDIDATGAVLGVEYFGSPGGLRKALEAELYEDLWSTLREFTRNF